MKANYLMLIASFILISACNVGVKKDLISGLKTTNNGLSFEEAYLTMDQVKLESNEFPLAKDIYIYIVGIQGFTTKEDRVFIGASMLITDEKGNVILDEKDLFESAGAEGFSLEDSQSISLKLTVGDPMTSGSKYYWKSKVWDKNGSGTINAEIEFVVK